MPGLLVRWRLTEARIMPATESYCGPRPARRSSSIRLLQGEITDANGQSRVALEPAVERQPGQGHVLTEGVTVYASLDKQNMPDAIKAFLSAKAGVKDALALTDTIWPKFLFDQIFDISLKAIQRAGMPVRKIHVDVEYHGADTYGIQGVRHPYLFFYSTMIDITPSPATGSTAGGAATLSSPRTSLC